MVSPTTLTFSVLVLVLGERPLRTGLWFYFGALGATLGIGVVAAFVLGNTAADPSPGTPKTWVSIFDVAAGVLLIAFVVARLRRPPNPKRVSDAISQMQKVASSPAVAILGAGAALANPGAFIPIALKNISELNPSATQYIVDWVFFAVVSLLPLLIALVLLRRRPRAGGAAAQQRARLAGAGTRPIVAAVIVVLLAVSLIRNGITGLT